MLQEQSLLFTSKAGRLGGFCIPESLREDRGSTILLSQHLNAKFQDSLHQGKRAWTITTRLLNALLRSDESLIFCWPEQIAWPPMEPHWNPPMCRNFSELQSCLQQFPCWSGWTIILVPALPLDKLQWPAPYLLTPLVLHPLNLEGFGIDGASLILYQSKFITSARSQSPVLRSRSVRSAPTRACGSGKIVQGRCGNGFICAHHRKLVPVSQCPRFWGESTQPWWMCQRILCHKKDTLLTQFDKGSLVLTALTAAYCTHKRAPNTGVSHLYHRCVPSKRRCINYMLKI